ncbi:MAG: antitoxin component YwqK of YwqJK toxin-antitoxin module [Lentimonas sp.]|jgi:antitoxin component YwqK of YwqJK toxin-antitoxin module
MKSIVLLFTLFALLSCQEETNVDQVAEVPFESIVIKNGRYTEYYLNTKTKKIEGNIDRDSLRNGRWDYFNTSGNKLSFTLYKHGKKHGHSYIAYPDGAPYYYGEYLEDSMVGVWKYFDQNGVKTEKDYGFPEGY